MFARLLTALCLIFNALHSELIETFFGPVSVEEPVLLELIASPAMQRLKNIHQYGVAYYTTHKEEYNRFDHSIGVFTILRKNNASLEKQIAGLLHDISHTVFSHVGDWVFGREYHEVDYQNVIYKAYLSLSGIEKILVANGYTIDQVAVKKEFALLEQALPNLCADRIDYNIQGAFYQGFLTKAEALELFNDIKYLDGRWIATRVDLLKKLARFSYTMTENCWGSAMNYMRSRWLADAILKGLDSGLIAWHELHFGIDRLIWNKLQQADDVDIQTCMHKIFNADKYFKRVDFSQEDVLIKFKNRGIDPWVMHQGSILRLTAIDTEIAHEFEELKRKAAKGIPIKIQDPVY